MYLTYECIEYVKKSRVYLEVLSKSSETCPNCIEKLCAYINNNRRFVELLKEQEVVGEMCFSFLFRI